MDNLKIKYLIQFVTFFAWLNISASETLLLTFEQPIGTERVYTVDYVVPGGTQVSVNSFGIVNNPAINEINNTQQSFKVELAYGHNWNGTFFHLILSEPIAINSQNRYLHILHYREIINDNWMVCLNTRTAHADAARGTLRFESNNKETGVWEDIVIDLWHLQNNNIPLESILFGMSMDWSNPRDNPAAACYFDEIVLSESAAPRHVTPITYNSFRNGIEWLDDRLLPINAHGGQLLMYDDKYYFIGEARRGFTSLGVSCYESTDLYNWKYRGLILPLVGPQDPNMQDAGAGRLTERPKIVYNNVTKQFVLWAHWEDGNDYKQARALVAYSDSITKPFTFHKTFRPHEQMSRDHTLFKDIDGKVYQFRSAENNATTQISELSSDFLDVKDPSSAGYKRIFVSGHYEAPCIMRSEDGKYFGIFSGTSGWDPNPAKLGVSPTVNGNWTYVNNPCVDQKASTTYDSQGTYIYKIPNKTNAYLYMGDRWNKTNVEKSTYVWLPISMRTGKPVLKWYEEWDLSLFDSINSLVKETTINTNETYYVLSQLSDKLLSDNAGSLIHWRDDMSRNIPFKLELDGGLYRLKHAQTNKYLTGSDTQLSFQDYSSSDAQRWTLKHTGNSFYKIICKLNNKCIDITSANTLDGAPVGLFTEKTSQSENQQWGFFRKTSPIDTGVELPSAIEKPIVVPNPSSRNFKIQLKTNYSNYKVRIFSANGTVIPSRTARTDNNIQIELPANQPTGIYLIQLFLDNRIYNLKTSVSD